MKIDEEMKELREAINIESHIALQLNTLLCKCNVCNAIGNLYIFLTIFKATNTAPEGLPSCGIEVYIRECGGGAAICFR